MAVHGSTKRKQDDNGSSAIATILCAAALVGGFVWFRLRGGSDDDEKASGEATGSKDVSQPPVMSGAKAKSRPAGSSKKKSKAAKADEKAKRADKRDKHMKDAPPPKGQEKDDGNNELFLNYTYHQGGRRDKATDAFGGKAIMK